MVKEAGENNTNELTQILGNNLPDEYIYLKSLVDSIDFGSTAITSTSELEKDKQFKEEFFAAFSKDYSSIDWGFFASDGMGGFFAFSNKANNHKVYYWDTENINNIEEWSNFTKWFEEQINLVDEEFNTTIASTSFNDKFKVGDLGCA